MWHKFISCLIIKNIDLFREIIEHMIDIEIIVNSLENDYTDIIFKSNVFEELFDKGKIILVKEFPFMCESLAKRLETEKSDAESAALCYMCAANGK